MKKWIISLSIVCFLSLLLGASAEAGDKSHRRWQGIAIGAASAVVLGHLLGHPARTVHTAYSAPAPRPFYPPGPCRTQYDRPRCEPTGYWERVWIPEHYDGFGKYVGGHYESYYVEGPRYTGRYR